MFRVVRITLRTGAILFCRLYKSSQSGNYNWYYDTDFNPVGGWFTIFETQDSKVLIGSFVIFDGTRYLAVTTSALLLYTGGEDWFSDGDVYGVFIGVIGDPNADGTEPTTPGLDLSGEYWFGRFCVCGGYWRIYESAVAVAPWGLCADRG